MLSEEGGELLGAFSEEEIEADPLLRIKGVTPKLAAALRDCGYSTVESIAIEPPHILFERVGERAEFSLEKTEAITREARKLLKVNVMTLGALEEEERGRLVVSTGSKKLDEMLEGGIRSGEPTGVSGPYSIGKTELVFTVALNTVKQLGA